MQNQQRAAERTANKRLPIKPVKLNSTVNISDLQEGDSPLILNIDTTLGVKRSIRDGFYVDYSLQEKIKEITKNKKDNIVDLKLIAAATSQDLSVDVNAFLANATLTDGTEKIAIIATVKYPETQDDKIAVGLFDKNFFYNIDTTFGCNFSIVGVSTSVSKQEVTYQGITNTQNKFLHSIAVNVNYNMPLTEAEKGDVATKPIFILSENSEIRKNGILLPQYSQDRNLGIGVCEMKFPKSASGVKFSTPVNCRYEFFKIPNLNTTIFAFDSNVYLGRDINTGSASQTPFFSWLDMRYWFGDVIQRLDSTWYENTGHVITIIDPLDPTTYRYIGFLSEEEYILSVHCTDSTPMLVSNKNIYKLVQDLTTPSAPYIIDSIIEKVYPIGPGVMVGNTLYFIGVNGIYKASVRTSLFNVEELGTKISNNFFLGIKNNLQSAEYVDAYYDANNSKVVFILNMNNQWLDRLYQHMGLQGQRTTSSQDVESNLTGLNFQAKTIIISIAVDTNEINLHTTSLRFKGKLANFFGYIDKEITGYDVTNLRNPALFKDLDYSTNKSLTNTVIHDKYSFVDEDFLVYTSAKHCNQDAGYPFYVIYGFNLGRAFKDAQTEMKSITVTGIDIIFSSRIDLRSEISDRDNSIEKLKEKITCVLIEHEESIMDMSREMIVKKKFKPGELILEPVGSYQLINRLRIPVKEMLLSGTLYVAFLSEIFSTLVSAYVTYHINMF